MSKAAFIKIRILAGIIGGLVCAAVFYIANVLLDTSFSNAMIILSSVFAAILFFFIVKPKQ